MQNNTHIVIIDDNLLVDDPLIIQLQIHDFIVNLFHDPREGLDFIFNNLSKKLIIVLDIDLGKNVVV